MGRNHRYVGDDLKVMTTCICPMCRRKHKVKLYWTGNGTPRIFCHPCRHYNDIENFTPEMHDIKSTVVKRSLGSQLQ